MLNGLIRRIRLSWLRVKGLQTNGTAWIQRIEIPRNHRAIRLASGVALDRGVTLLVSGTNETASKISIGTGSYINRNVMIDASCSVKVGENCMVGPFVYVTDHDHGLDPAMLIKDQPLTELPVVIADDVWIGAHASILKGVTLGTGSVVAAGAVVTQSVEPYDIVGGVPARVIGHRKGRAHD